MGKPLFGTPTTYLNEEDVARSYNKLESLLSSKKARECIQRAEESLAFDTELFLQPIRNHLGDCFVILGDLIRERGIQASDIQPLVPEVQNWLGPGSKFAEEVARLERTIAEKKRKHPDFVMAYKLQMLVKRCEDQLAQMQPDTGPYFDMEDKLEKTRNTLHNHKQTKLRIAQRALAPEMLELAISQLELSEAQEKVLIYKQELLDASRKRTRENLTQIANLFKDVEPELAETILSHTRSLVSTGQMTQPPERKEIPQNLQDYRQALEEQSNRLQSLEKQISTCQEKLDKLREFEETIFSTFGDKLRERGIEFKKPVRAEKSGTGQGIMKKQPAVRMVNRKQQK